MDRGPKGDKGALILRPGRVCFALPGEPPKRLIQQLEQLRDAVTLSDAPATPTLFSYQPKE
jgi:hypothetical protein